MPSHCPLFIARLIMFAQSLAGGVSLQLFRLPPTQASLPKSLVITLVVTRGGVWGNLPPLFWKENPSFFGRNPLSARKPLAGAGSSRPSPMSLLGAFFFLSGPRSHPSVIVATA